MAKEYFWGATVSKDKRVFKWDPESEFLDDDDDDDDYAISHFLFLKQAVLGAEVEETERNVVEVETVDFDGEKVKQPLFSLKLGLNESTTLDMGLQPPVTFKLVKGSGPVFLSGQHALDLQEDEDFGEEFKGGEGLEMSDEEVDEKEGEEDEEKVKKVSTKGKDKKKAAKKDVKAPKKRKGDELEDWEDEDEDEDEAEDEDEEDEEEEEEEEKQTGKGKKRPAPSAKGPAKKMSKPAFNEEDDDEDDDDDDDEHGIDWKLAKVDKDGKSRRKVPNGSIENGHADDDDDDDEEDEDYKVDDEEEEEATSGEEEEEEEEEDDEEMALGDEDDEDDDEEDDEDDEGMDDEDEEDEDEEEESSPEKPAKKAKGKVNGTVKPKGAPKSQQSKPKEKKEKKVYTIEDIKQDIMKSPSKPKKEEKFKNFVKSRFHLSEAKKIQELWGWYKSSQLK